MNIRLIPSGLVAGAALCAVNGTVGAQIFVANSAHNVFGAGTIGKFTTSGTTMNPALISGLSLQKTS